MLKNYLRVAVRNLIRHKGYSFINIAGMSLGMASCILILLWVQHELSFDQFLDDGEQLFIVWTKQQYGDNVGLSLGTPPAVARALREEYPEILNSTRWRDSFEVSVRYGDLIFNENLTRVDANFLEIFSFPMIIGDAANALREPMSIVLSESAAEKYFGGENPVGKSLILDGQYDFTITGVVADPPANSTLQFDFLAPLDFDTLYFGTDLSTWYNCSFFSFVKLEEGSDWRALQTRLTDRVKKSDPESTLTLFLFPLTDLHLHSVRGTGGRIERVRSFAMVAALVLFIACINFMNLSTARAGSRAKEVGVRKVVGARRSELMAQFYCESLVQSVVAAFLAAVLVEISLPRFVSLTGAELQFDLLRNPSLQIGVLLITLMTALVAGSYPALFLSSFRPAQVLKNRVAAGARGLWFRRGLVIFQFALSIALIISTTVVYQQFMLLRNKALGYDTEQVLCQPLTEDLRGKFEIIKRELEAEPSFRHVAWSSHHPAEIFWNGSSWDWQGKDPDVDPHVTYMGVGYDLLETLGLSMTTGEYFSPETEAVASHKVVINQTLAKILGPESPVGKILHHPEGTYTVLGVVEDFHFTPVYREIGALMMFFRPEDRKRGVLLAKIEAEQVGEAVAHLEEVWRQHAPDTPFELSFLDEIFDRLYRDEQQMAEVLRAFAVLAVLISGLGLFGLASFMAEQRTKEIGIRKVLGASVPSIVLMMTHEFTRWVLLANLLAWPLAYFVMRHWLERFTFQTELGVGVFLGAAAAAVTVALLTVSLQATRAATNNPVRALRYE